MERGEGILEGRLREGSVVRPHMDGLFFVCVKMSPEWFTSKSKLVNIPVLGCCVAGQQWLAVA
jgi:hypothetical protein